ncbi:11769_t:CDS:1, partial [Cetraspora pellucida]
PWNISQDTEEFRTGMKVSPSESGYSTHDHWAIIEGRREELAADIETFKELIKLVGDNIENDKFYETYQALKQPLIAETAACKEVLNAKNQQRTWKLIKDEKLTFWLH